MKLRKDKWLELEFPEAIDFQEGPGILAKDFRTNGVPLIRLAGMDDGVSLLNGCNYLDEELVARKYEHFKLKKDDIILSTSATLGKTSYVDDEAVGAIVYTGLVRMRPKNGEVYAPFIKYLLQSPRFKQQIESMGVGSVMKHFGPTHLKKISITLPTFDEQKTISELFPALETAMEQVDGQEKSLKALRKKLIDALSEKDKTILKAFDTTKWEKTKIEEVAYWYQKDIPNDRQREESIVNYLAADHIEPGEIFIDRNGTLDDGKKGPTITKYFRKGDFLLSTRSVALHKAAVAHIDGVTGEKLIVLDVKPCSQIIKEFLPYVMHSTNFWRYAKVTASGSVNKFSSWNKIKLYEFYLPSKEEQSVILKVFEQLEANLSQLKQQKATLKLLKQKLLNEILG